MGPTPFAPPRGIRPAARTAVLISLLLAAGGTSGCRRPAGESGGNRLTVAGSTSLQPLAERFAEHYSPAAVTVQAGGSTAGIRATHDRRADIGMSSRPLDAEEREGIQQVVVAIDGLAIVVHPSNPVRSLTRAQLRDLFSGRVRNWRRVGGADARVILVTREEGSGTRATFEEMVMRKAPIASFALVTAFSGGLRRMVADDPRAIGYMTISQVGPGVRQLSVDGVMPTEADIARGSYPLSRPLLFLVRPDASRATREFLAWVTSPDGQAIVRRERLVPAAVDVPAATDH